METCFVIQPFDKGTFDKRFNDVFKPAIEKAQMKPYRIDEDMSVRIPIDNIEKGIMESSLCFAEISTDNPNVWYELGFAFACGKDVVLVCSDERIGNKFPFDIQHRHIITYSTRSKSDFEELENTITKKIIALQQKTKKIQTLNESPVVATEGLKSHEIALLILLAQNQFTGDDHLSIHYVKSEMNKAGYTDIATSVGLKTLDRKKYLSIFQAVDHEWNNADYAATRLTEDGENWILNNQDQLVFRLEKPNSSPQTKDDLPF